MLIFPLKNSNRLLGCCVVYLSFLVSSSAYSVSQFNTNMSTGDHPECILGLDLGTTSVKCVVINRQTSQVLAKQSKDTQVSLQ